MSVTNTARVLNFLPYAMGSYGTGGATQGLSVGNASPVAIEQFRATPGSGFQGSLYKDSVTGKYTIAFAGTNDLTDALVSDAALATSNFLTNLSAGTWDPQMTDALKFTGDAFVQIQSDYLLRNGRLLTVDEIRNLVTVTGHSLGGSLAELTSKFYGLHGANIDGPGVSAFVRQPEFADLKRQLQVDLPGLQEEYTLDPSQFGAYAYTVVGVAGTHLHEIEVQMMPRAEIAEAAMIAAAGSAATLNLMGLGLSIGVAGSTAMFHASGAILAETERLANVAAAGPLPLSPFGNLMRMGSMALSDYAAPSSTLTALQLRSDSERARSNVEAGLSPSGIPLDGSWEVRSGFRVSASVDPDTGRIRETYTSVDQYNNYTGAVLSREYLVDAGGRIGVMDTHGNMSFVMTDTGTIAAVVHVSPDGEVRVTTSAGESGIFVQVPPHIVSRMLDGQGDWVNTIIDQSPLSNSLNGTLLPPNDVSPPTTFTGPMAGGDYQEQSDQFQVLIGACSPDLGVQIADGGFDVSGVISDAGSGSGMPQPYVRVTLVNSLFDYLDTQGSLLTIAQQSALSAQIDSLRLGGDNDLSFYTLPSGGALIANADGDIVGEITGGNGGDIHLRAMGLDAHGNTVEVSNHISSTGAVLTEAQFAEAQTQQVLSDLNQGIGLFNALGNIQNWGTLTDVGRLSALVGLYNAADGLGAVFGGSGDNLPGSLGTAAGVLSLVQGIQSGDALLIANGFNNVANQVVDRSLDQAFGSSGVPYVGIALALSNLEDDPMQSVGTLVGMAIAGPLGGAVGGFIGGALGGLLGGGPPPPPAGHVVYAWDDAGQIIQTLDFEQSNGGAAAAHIAASVLALLEGAVQSINSQAHDAAQHVALNPYRMPSVHFADGHTWLYSEQADGNSPRLDLNDPNLAQALVQALGSNGGLLPEWQVRTLQTHLQTLHASGASAEDIAAERDAAVAEAMQAGSDAQAGTLVYALQGNAVESADFRTQSFGALIIHLEGAVQALQTTAQAAVDGVQTTHVLRNTDSDDYLEQTQWVSATDANGTLQGMLVLDFNGNGQIETRDILNLGGNLGQTGNATTEAALATQNAALQRNNTNWLDANGDGVLDAHDPAFAAIRLWVDLQSNGLVEPGEMQGLADTGVTSINLRTGQVNYSGTDAQGHVVDRVASMLATTLSSNTSGVRLTHIMQVNADGSLDALNAGEVLEHEGYQGQVYTVDSGTGGGWGGVRQQTYTHEALRTGDWEGTADQDVHRHGGGNVAIAPTETRATSASDFGPVRTQANPISHSTVTDSDTRVVSDAPMQAPQVRPQTQVFVNSGDSTIRSNPPTSGRLVGGATPTAMRPTDSRIAFVPTTPSSVRGEVLAVTAAMIESSNNPFFGSGTHAGLGVLTAVGLGAVQTVQAAEPHSTQARDTAPDDMPVSIGIDVRDTPNTMPNSGGLNMGSVPLMFRQVDLGPLSAASEPPVAAPDIAQPTAPLPSASNVVGTATDEVPSFYATLVASTPLQIPTVPVFRVEPPTEADGVILGNPSVRIETLRGAEDGILRWTPAVLLAQASTPNASAVPSQPALTITAVSHPLNGHVSLVNGEVWFAPAPNFHGTASFSYTVTDQYGMSASCRVTLQVDAVNDAPVASGEQGTSNEDTGVIFTPAQLLANDLDDDIATDSQVLRISRVGQAQNGIVWLDTQGNLRFEPSANYHGPAQFTYWVSDGLVTDGAGAETPATVILTILAANDIPIANSEVVNSSEDRTLLFDTAHLLANDGDVDTRTDGQVLRIAAVGNASHGTVTFANQPDGSQHVLFTPDTDYFGVASFQYTVSDGAGGTAVGTVVVNVVQVNDAPVATNDILVSTEEDTGLHISLARLLGNDTDADSANAQWGGASDVLVVVAVGNAVHGTVALVDLADGTQEAVFIPEANYHGPASFMYQVRDGSGAVAQAWATFEVTAVNDVPVVVGETIDSSEDTPLLISPAALLQNDSDVDTATDRQVTRVIAVSNAQHGTVTLNANGTISFVPDRNFFGAASFDYTVDDGNGGQSTATATIALANVNDAPLATGETIQSIEDEALTIQATALLHNDSDVDSPITDLTIARVQSGTGGTAALNASGNVVFTPEANYNGTATFTYWVRDSAGQESSQVTATVLLSAVNDAPSAQGEIIAGASEDAMFRISAALLLANDNDADDPGGALRLSWVGHATGGTVSLDSNGDVVFIPHANFHGNATFSYRARDAAGLESVTVQAVVPVASVNDNPVGVDDQFQTYNNATMTIGFGQLTGNDRDADGDALSIAAVRNNAHGHVQIVNGQVQFVPTAGFTGTAAFDYLADDGHGGQVWATAYVGVREAPNRYPTLDVSDVSIHWFNPQYVEVLSMTIYFNINDDGNPGATQLQLVSAVERNGGWWPDATSLTTYGLSGGSGHIQVLGPVVFGTAEFGVRTYFNDYRSTWVVTDERGLQNTWHFDFYDYGINSWSYRGYADHYGYYYPPLVMDLNGDGVHFASIDQSNVAFDVNADGTDDRMAWAGHDDGVLVWDRDQNHRITDATEFGFQTLRPGAQTDLEGLQALDTNANGLLDAGDTSFSDFAVWQDANGNGTTEVGEFNTLVELGITSISLASDGQLRDAGSVLADSANGETDAVVMGNAVFTRADGTTGVVADTLLAFEPGRASLPFVANSMADLQVAEVIRQALLFNQVCNAAVPAESDALGFIPIAPAVELHDALVTSQDGYHPLHQPA